MKLSDIENAKKAHNILKRLNTNISNLLLILQEDQRKDSGGIEGVFEYGFWCSVSEYNDGSGKGVDLNGCYVANQVYKATLDVLIEQRENVLAYLTSIGVRVEEESDDV